MIDDDSCESSDTDAVTHQMNLLAQVGPKPEDKQHNVTKISSLKADTHSMVNLKNASFFKAAEQCPEKSKPDSLKYE